MATPLTGLQHRDGGGGVAFLSNSVNKIDSASSPNDCLRSSEPQSPILIFLFFHKAIRNELDTLHRLAMAFATGQRADIRPLFERYHFLRSIYKHHSNAEDEVKFLIHFPYGFVLLHVWLIFLRLAFFTLELCIFRLASFECLASFRPVRSVAD